MDENEILFDDDELFDDEYADNQQNGLSDYQESDQPDFLEDEEEEQEDGEQVLEQEEEEDAITQFLKSKGIDARSVKFENEDGDLEEIDFNDLSTSEKLQILNSGNEQHDDNDLSDDEIELLNQIRRNNWSVEDYNKYIASKAVQDYQQNNDTEYSVNNISDDELFLLDLKSQVPDISDEELAEELEYAKRNATVFARRVDNLRQQYTERENQYRQHTREENSKREQEQMRQFTDQIINTIQNNRYMDVGLGQETIELTDQDMQDVANFILGKDDAGNRYFANALNDPEALVKMAWYITKGPEVFQEIGDYYKQQITKARKSAYNKGYDDAVSGRNNSRKAVVSKRQPSREQKREQTIYDLD